VIKKGSAADLALLYSTIRLKPPTFRPASLRHPPFSKLARWYIIQKLWNLVRLSDPPEMRLRTLVQRTSVFDGTHVLRTNTALYPDCPPMSLPLDWDDGELPETVRNIRERGGLDLIV
jgi:hypothetical protein